jgi:hypothetical protein
MHNRILKGALLGLALAGMSMSAQAHRGWLLPSTAMVEAKEPWVTLDGAISEGLFEFHHVPLRLDNLTITGPDGVTTKAEGAVLGKFRSTIDIPLPKNGTYRLAIVSNNVMGSYKLGGEVKRFRGVEGTPGAQVPAGATDVTTSTTHTRLETFVSANDMNDTALKPSGVGLEMVPVTNPSDLRAGEPITFRFQLDGKPLPNFPFSMVPGAVKYRGTLGELRFTTDARGEVKFTVPEANMYWLSAKFPLETQKGPPAPGAKRYSYTATLDVLPQ